mmetsp:Transcript_13452/g.20357  ORF Transcript_13452/g.20357 Transcript_13452/m.20357 type:complete len:4776 (+) Transcript_13452:55-14382(+)
MNNKFFQRLIIVIIMIIMMTLSTVKATCVSGMYMNCNDECVDCPVGHYCENDAKIACPAGTASAGVNQTSIATCSACPANYYAPENGTISCKACPRSHTCADSSKYPVPCAGGTYTENEAEATCIACPEGYACAAMGYNHTKSTEPQLCRRGTVAAEGSEVCTACKAGNYSDIEGGTTCKICPAGTMCPRTDEGPIACVMGTYAVQGSVFCHPCPAGYSCIRPSETPTACPTGTFAAYGFNILCQECPLGTYADEQRSSRCHVCPAGHSCINRKLAPVACSAGEYSPKGHHACEVCPAGTLVRSDQSGCDPCLAGQSCTGTASTSCPAGQISMGNASQCIQCRPGTVANNDKCDPCPEGYYCPDGENVVACPDGYFSTGKQARCDVIPAGSNGTKWTNPNMCPDGTYSPAGSEGCTPCPAGKYCTVPTAPPVSCPSGSFSAEGDVTCSQCPAGSSCNDTGVTPCSTTKGSIQYSPLGYTMCLDCPPGFACNLTMPTPCPPGRYSSSGADNCTICPAGHFCSNPGVAPVECPDGTASAPGAEHCDPCDAGKYCTSKVKTCVENNCLKPQVDCAAGFFSVPGSIECSSCPAGFACPSRKGFAPIACALGTYSGNGSTSCTLCPAGSYCDDPAGTPKACTPGSFSREGASVCTICPAGSYCDVASENPKQCPNGRYSLQNETDPNCQPCAAGYYCPAGSASSTPQTTLCEQGKFCDTTGIAQSCPEGTVGIAEGSFDQVTGCATCPAGFYCPINTEAVNVHQRCPRGFYCPPGTTFSTEFPCPEGTYNPKIGSISASDCITCPPGYYCEEGSYWYGEFPCLEDYFCPEGTHSFASTVEQGRYQPRRCPRGTYNPSQGGKNMSDCQTCPAGRYCPWHNNRNNGPSSCGSGTYNPHTGAPDWDNCISCPRGHACPAYSVTGNHFQYRGTRTKYTCYPGHYCDERTGCNINGDNCIPVNRCPGGTFTTSYHLKNVLDCSICWEGYACDTTSGPIGYTPGAVTLAHTIGMTICAAGHYCPGAPHTGNGSHPYTLRNWDREYTTYANQYDCPPGTWSDVTGLKRKEDCKVCPPGKYCEGGEATDGQDCPTGYYCPGGTDIAQRHPCPAGTYNPSTRLTNKYDCLACPAGSYCDEGSSAPVVCPAGTYAPNLRTRSSGPTNSTDNSGCIQCPHGSYCPENSVEAFDCGIGNYSAYGQSTCKECPAGRYCPLNTTSEVDMLDVFICTAGTYCPNGTATYPEETNRPCTPGYYCPPGTPIERECPPGTYNPFPGANSTTECLSCPRGEYCVGGKTAPTGNCSLGYYCEGGASTPTQFPCPARTYRNFTGAHDIGACTKCISGHYCPEATGTPIPCPEGHYCIIGTVDPEPCPKGTYNPNKGLIKITQCLPCPPGKYCDTLGQVQPSGDCDAGYYCIENAFTAAPQGPPTGGLCPRGGFCPKGSSGPSSCAPGTFNNFTGAKSQADCAPCTPGHYCAGSSNPFPTGPCSAGYYCLSNDTHRASDPRQFPVTPGHYSVVGSQTEIPCKAGTYANSPLSENSCDPCDVGYYCPDIRMTEPEEVCPKGSYCSAGSILPKGCPRGTFGDETGYQNISQCNNCPIGKYCDSIRLDEAGGDCLKGYFCYGSSKERNPVNQTYGDKCPTGHYCGVGTTTPTPCPAGKFNPDKGMYNVNLCIPCRAGTYCQGTGLTGPTAVCAAGTYCPAGLESQTSTGTACPADFYCPEGTAAPIPCPNGNETTTTSQTTCSPCIAGKYCFKGSTRFNCPAGHYCPAGTGIEQPECPAGSYSNAVDIQDVNSCVLCPEGKFCSVPGLTVPNGDCLAGTYCKLGASNIHGDPGVLGGESGICSPGNFCPQGSERQNCSAGSFNAREGLHSQSECSFCPPGKYCPDEGQVNATLNCDAGYYCIANSTVSNPTDGIVGNVCPTGHYCPEGSGEPIPCPVGTYSGATGAANCTICPAGKFCIGTTTTPSACPVGRYCEPGTGITKGFCPPGTFSNALNLGSIHDCTLCTAGKYCSKKGLTAPNGDCRAGIACLSGAINAKGVTGALGGNSTICPKGSYCPKGVTEPTPCPVSTFGNWTGSVRESDCKPCPPGRFCSTLGTIDPTNNHCTAGYFCTLGASTPTPTDGTTGNICPQGHYCGNGTMAPTPCPAGTFQAGSGQSFCNVCPIGKFCNIGTIIPSNCTEGSYCESGSSYNLNECPPGTFSNSKSLTNVSECQLCTPGKICSKHGLSAPDGDCLPGVFCGSGAAQSDGTLGAFGGSSGVCPSGHYCPLGSSGPLACPEGTYQPATGKTYLQECIGCPAGKYCSGVGQSSPTGTCFGGFYCPVNQTVPNPPAYACKQGFKCPNGSAFADGCPDGTFGAAPGATECVTCPAGSYCNENATAPIICPDGSYCPASSSFPIICRNGTYGNGTGLIDQSQCRQCPEGYFCNGGQIIDKCAAGWVCSGSSPSRIPTDVGGYICPVGHYCPEGATAPIRCPNNFYSAVEGGRSVAVCGPCPKGYFCDESSQSPCLPGHYCPFISGLIKCPLGTYNPNHYGTNLTSCIPCPEGNECNATGLASLDGLQCPKGHFCPEGAYQPTPCGKGTYRDQFGGTNVSSCYICPPGHYCRDAQVDPIVCKAGRTCPAGSFDEQRCPRRHYCQNAGNYEPEYCPASFYCPENTTNPIACPLGYFCPEGAYNANNCPLGFRSSIVTSPRSSVANSCLMCGVGHYGNHSIDIFNCLPCDAGYMCYGNSSHPRPIFKNPQNGEPCFRGHYCPKATTKMFPCPVGTYLDKRFGTSLESCIDCNAGTYQSKTAATQCLTCGSSSASGLKSTACTCKGANRVWFESDNTCRCRTGYTWYDADNVEHRDVDGSEDCIIKTKERCTTGFERNAEGQCVAAETGGCQTVCSGASTFSTTYGICECSEAKTESEVYEECDEDCRTGDVSLRVNIETGRIEIVNASNPNTIISSTPLNRDFNEHTQCNGTSCRLYVNRVRPTGGFVGRYNPSSPYLIDLYTSSNTTNNSTARRSVFSLNAIMAETNYEVANPITCIQKGDGIIFDVSGSFTNYPKYNPDDLLNTNEEFDYGLFLQVAEAKSKGSPMKVFSFIFNEVGVYVFVDAGDETQKTIVNVVAQDNDICGDKTFRPISERSLQGLEIGGLNNVVLDPDWNMVGLLLIGIFCIISSILAAYHYFSTRLWSKVHLFPKRQHKEKKISKISAFFGEKVVEEEKKEVEFNFDILDSKMNEHSSQIGDRVDNYRDEFKAKFDKILSEAEEIRVMLENREKMNLSITYNTTALLDALPESKTAHGIEKVNETLNSQRKEFETAMDQHVSPKVREEVLTQEQVDRLKTLDDHDVNQRKRINKLYKSYSGKFSDLLDRINEEKESDSPNEDQLKKLTNEYNKLLHTFKIELEGKLNSLNDTMIEKDELMKIQQSNLTYHLDPKGAELVKGFLKKKVKELFDRYKLDKKMREEESDDDDDSIMNFNDLSDDEDYKGDGDDDDNEEEDNDINLNNKIDAEDVDENRTAEERMREEKKRIKKRLANRHKDEIKKLNESMEEEFQVHLGKVDETFNDMMIALNEKHASTKNEILSNNDISLEEKQNMLKSLEESINEQKQALEKERENQTQHLRDLLEKKRAKKLSLMEKRQKREKDIFMEDVKDDKHMLKSFVQQLMADGTGLTSAVGLELLKQKEALKNKLAVQTQKRLDRQEAERLELEENLDAEDKMDLHFHKENSKKIIQAKVNAKRAQELAAINIRNDLSDDEKQKLISEMEENLKNYRDSLNDERKKEEAKLKRLIAVRRSARLRALEKKHQDEENAEIIEKERDLIALKKLMEVSAEQSQDYDGARSREKLKQSRAIQRKIDELIANQRAEKKKHNKEIKELEEEHKKEHVQEIEKIEEKFAKDRKQTLIEKKNDLKEALAAPDVDDVKKEKLLATHKLQIQDYEERMELLKKQQLEALDLKMAEKLRLRKKQKRDEAQAKIHEHLQEQEKALDKLHENETDDLKDKTIEVNVSLKQQQDLTDLEDAHKKEISDIEKKHNSELEESLKEYDAKLNMEAAKKTEALNKAQNNRLTALKSKMEADMTSSAENEKQRIQEEYNHQVESLELKRRQEIERHENEIRVKLAARRKKLEKKRDKSLDKKKSEHESAKSAQSIKSQKEAEKKAVLDLLMNDNDDILSIEDAINRVVMVRHKRELEDLTQKQREERRTSKDEQSVIELRFTEKRVQLKRRHVLEKKNLAKEFDKYRDLINKGNDDTRLIEEELERFQQQIASQKAAALKKISEEKEKLKKQMEEELQKAREQAAKEKRELLERLNKQKNKLQVENMVKEREMKMKIMMEQQKNLAQDEKTRLLDEARIEMSAFEDALEFERKRQNNILQKRITQYERAIAKKKQKEMEEELELKYGKKEVTLYEKKEQPAAEAETNESKTKKTVLARDNTMSMINLIDPRGQRTVTTQQIITIEETEILKERPYMERILKKIKKIEMLMDNPFKPYVDARDLGMKNEGELVKVLPNELSISELLLLRFGEFVIALIRSRFNIKREIKIAVASKLPHTDYGLNCFKHSFYYDYQRHMLFIRRGRLDKIGMFVTILVHCVAHIIVGDLDSDYTPEFKRMFYSMMESIFEDVFNMRHNNKLIPSDASQSADQLVNFLVNMNQNAFDPTDALSKMKIRPTGVSTSLPTAQEAAKPRIKYTPKGKDGKEELKNQLQSLIKDRKQNEQVMRQQALMVKKIKAKMQEEAGKLKKLAGDKTSPAYKKQASRLRQYSVQHDDAMRKIQAAKQVDTDMKTKMAELAAKIKQ